MKGHALRHHMITRRTYINPTCLTITMCHSFITVISDPNLAVPCQNHFICIIRHRCITFPPVLQCICISVIYICVHSLPYQENFYSNYFCCKMVLGAISYIMISFWSLYGFDINSVGENNPSDWFIIESSISYTFVTQNNNVFTSLCLIKLLYKYVHVQSSLTYVWPWNMPACNVHCPCNIHPLYPWHDTCCPCHRWYALPSNCHLTSWKHFTEGHYI